MRMKLLKMLKSKYRSMPKNMLKKNYTRRMKLLNYFSVVTQVGRREIIAGSRKDYSLEKEFCFRASEKQL